jgi:demethylmenaquinone methyltransferase/2-methoxy-6-polyprenyl-1,4-benzoquinol methylase
MFAEAGFEEFEHHIQQRAPGTPRAITTVARVPDDASDEKTTDAETASTA